MTPSHFSHGWQANPVDVGSVTHKNQGSKQATRGHMKEITSQRAHLRQMFYRLSMADDVLWRQLRKHTFMGVGFNRQQSLDYYRLDFYAPAVSIAIELDAGQHAGMDDRRQQKLRAAALKRQGVMLIRFTTDEVLGDMESVIWRLQAVIRHRRQSRLPGGNTVQDRIGMGAGTRP